MLLQSVWAFGQGLLSSVVILSYFKQIQEKYFLWTNINMKKKKAILNSNAILGRSLQSTALGQTVEEPQ